MKRILLSAACLLSTLLLGAEVRKSGDLVYVNTQTMSMVLRARQGGELTYMYVGSYDPSLTAESLSAAGSMNQSAYPV